MTGSSASSTRCTHRSTPRESGRNGCRGNRRPIRTSSIGISGSARRRGGSTTRATWRAIGAATGTSIREGSFSTGERTPSTCANGPTRPTAPCPIEYAPSETEITCTYANGVKVILDFLKDAVRKTRTQLHYATGNLPRSIRGGTKAPSKPVTAARSWSSPNHSRASCPSTSESGGLDVSEHARNFFDAVKSRKPTVLQLLGDAAFPHRLPRPPHCRGFSAGSCASTRRRRRLSTTRRLIGFAVGRSGSRGRREGAGSFEL